MTILKRDILKTVGVAVRSAGALVIIFSRSHRPWWECIWSIKMLRSFNKIVDPIYLTCCRVRSYLGQPGMTKVGYSMVRLVCIPKQERGNEEYIVNLENKYE